MLVIVKLGLLVVVGLYVGMRTIIVLEVVVAGFWRDRRWCLIRGQNTVQRIFGGGDIHR